MDPGAVGEGSVRRSAGATKERGRGVESPRDELSTRSGTRHHAREGKAPPTPLVPRGGPFPLSQARGGQSGTSPPSQARGRQSGTSPPSQARGRQSGTSPPRKLEGDKAVPPPLASSRETKRYLPPLASSRETKRYLPPSQARGGQSGTSPSRKLEGDKRRFCHTLRADSRHDSTELVFDDSAGACVPTFDDGSRGVLVVGAPTAHGGVQVPTAVSDRAVLRGLRVYPASTGGRM